MATYLIGDVQGCFERLQALLTKIDYQADQDTLWFCGDLVNRGPESLEVLRFVKDSPNCHTVLGNHDLHLLELTSGYYPKTNHTLGAVLEAPDYLDILNWLIKRPLAHYQADQNFLVVHAGVYPGWSLEEILSLSQEVSTALQQDTDNLMRHMYGDQPAQWNPALTGVDRLRFIINACTRMRYIGPNKTLDFAHHEGLDKQPNDMTPWFDHPEFACQNTTIVFGHWAWLQGSIDRDTLQGIDGGCVWGESQRLIAWRVDDRTRHTVSGWAGLHL